MNGCDGKLLIVYFGWVGQRDKVSFIFHKIVAKDAVWKQVDITISKN